MGDETLTRDFILGHAYGPGLGRLGLGLFFLDGPYKWSAYENGGINRGG
jgi:hypothetical protein